MKLDIARLRLVPAFLTLCALTLVAAWGGMTVPHGADASDYMSRSMPLLGGVLDGFEAAHPIWARLIAGAMLLLTGLTVGRIGIRYNLYTVKTCLSIPLYGVAVCGIAASHHHLVAMAASTLLALAVKNYCRAFCNGYGFDAIFRASLYLGLIPLILAPATPLVLILLPALSLFRRTLREALVAAVALLLPTAVACYVAWARGGAFFQPPIELYEALTDGVVLQLFTQLPLQAVVMPVAVVLLSLGAVIWFVTDFYAVGNKSRMIFFFVCAVAACALALFFTPAACIELFVLSAVPAALLLPVMFVRIHRNVARPLYLLLLVAAVLVNLV